MQKLKKIILRTLAVLAGLYVLLCTGLYFFQEKLIFFPTKLEQSYVFNFQKPFAEITIPTKDNLNLHGVLFYSQNKDSLKNKSKKKLVFYLHGNVGQVQFWGNLADVYTELGYDLFILDYRGYGKSKGKIYSQEQFFNDVQTAYDFVRKTQKYDEENIVVVGYSVGTASAAMLASQNTPKSLILQAPYFSLTDMTTRRFPFVPTFLLKYEFHTAKFLSQNKVPTYIFHGTADRVIPYESSLMIKEYLENNLNDKVNKTSFITLPNQGHANIHSNPIFLKKLKEVL
ncbi:alpha/beta hydrolase [Bernardetia sp.]|uniref:alpha/beta hydrolase n=1 Tax=Bernardetia sp. TaxID=1937974 RepID=UPI0025BAA6EF|nr:alpha/beta fold hydrolase [Bernardetia sp.]